MTAPRNKWEVLLDTKPKAVKEHLVDEAARLFAQDLQRWPLPLEAVEPSVQTLLQEHPLRPEPRLFRQAFRLARYELLREFTAFDDYVRNQRWLEVGLGAMHKTMLLFLCRYLTEQLLALGEATHGRVPRSALLQVLAGTEKRFFEELPS